MTEQTGNADETAHQPGRRLNELLREAGYPSLSEELSRSFEDYLALLMRWNMRVNLTAVRSEDGILARHFVESIVCAHRLPSKIKTLLDFGSGAGFPGIPIALCRSDIAVTLAESQGKKAAFLQEAIRVLFLPVKVHAGRAEMLGLQFDCVCLRAVDHMSDAVETAGQLVVPGGWLVLMTTAGDFHILQTAAGAKFSWSALIGLPGSEDRAIALGRRTTETHLVWRI